jgi:hypothetical protein
VAQDVHAQLRALLLGSIAAVAACSSEEARDAGGSNTPQERRPRSIDTEAIREQDLVVAVLDECHRPLQNRMDRLVATVTGPDGTATQLFAELPGKLRVQSQAGRFLLRDGAVGRVDGDAAVNADEQRRARDLRDLLDAAAFGPLHRASGCRRLGTTTFALAVDGGEVGLDLRGGTLLPAALRFGDATITIDEYVSTPTSHVARVLTHPRLGRCRVVLEQANVAWDAEFFATPGAAVATDRKPSPAPGSMRLQPGGAGEARSPTPQLVALQPLRHVVVADPGDWPARAAAYRPLHDELVRQEQSIAGFPVLWHDERGRWLAAPFRRRADGPTFAPPGGWNVRDVSLGRQLVVYPATGTLDERVAAGERLLREALAAQQLRALGPITAQPFFHLQEGVPPANKLAAPVVRVAVVVE